MVFVVLQACNLEDKGCSLVFGTSVSVVMSVAVAVTEKLLFFCTRSLHDEAGQLMTSYLNGTNTKEIWGRVSERNKGEGMNVKPVNKYFVIMVFGEVEK